MDGNTGQPLPHWRLESGPGGRSCCVIVRAFDRGAADSVVKPFSPTDQAARIRAALRRGAAPEWAEPSGPFVFGELTNDCAG